MLVAVDDMVGRHVLGPVFSGFVVAWNVLFRTALEDRDVKVLGIEVQHVDKILPGIVDGAFLEVIAEAPVAEHLEHRVVIRVVAHLFEVVVLAADAQTLL